MAVLVTGGAGYVGSIVARHLVAAGLSVVILDNLAQGHAESIGSYTAFVNGDLRERSVISGVIKSYGVTEVVHLAALSVVGMSVVDPRLYYETNIIGTLNLLDAMIECDVSCIVFASSAAVYGSPAVDSIDEEVVLNPVNPYGETKVVGERMIESYRRAYGLNNVILRLFNVAGAVGPLGENHFPETHLIPLVMKLALRGGSPLHVFGIDYPTPDGTCLRDYVHVSDVARAVELAIELLGRGGSTTCNLGRGVGESVLEVIDAVQIVTGKRIVYEVKERRPGDPRSLVADIGRARKTLGWTPQVRELRDIVESVWQWNTQGPKWQP